MQIKFKIDNSLIIILYFFQYGLLAPFSILLKGQYAIILFSLFLMIYSFLNNRKIPVKIILLFIIPLCLLIIKLPFEYDVPNGNYAIEMLISHLTMGMSGIYIGSLKFSSERFLYYGYKVGWINLLLLFLLPFTSLYGEEINYMRLGYALLPTVIFSFIFLFKKETKWSAFVLFIISFMEVLVFGARGAMLVFILFALAYIYIVSNIKKTTKYSLTIVIFLIVIGLKTIFKFIINIFEKYNLSSYSITKYLNVIEGDSFASTSSGRNEIYETAFARIENSLWFGSPINSCFVDTGSAYYHNIFLDILVNFGVFVFIMFISFLVFQIYKAIRYFDKEFKVIFFILFTVSIGRLIVSSSLWQRPEFWVFMSFCVCFNEERYKKI